MKTKSLNIISAQATMLNNLCYLPNYTNFGKPWRVASVSHRGEAVFS